MLEEKKKLEEEIERLVKVIDNATKSITALKYQLTLLSFIRFEVTEWNIKGKSKKVKWGVWEEKFKDDDTDECIIIDRRCPVEVDGVKCDEFMKPLGI